MRITCDTPDSRASFRFKWMRFLFFINFRFGFSFHWIFMNATLRARLQHNSKVQNKNPAHSSQFLKYPISNIPIWSIDERWTNEKITRKKRSQSDLKLWNCVRCAQSISIGNVTSKDTVGWDEKKNFSELAQFVTRPIRIWTTIYGSIGRSRVAVIERITFHLRQWAEKNNEITSFSFHLDFGLFVNK